jgi:hypothetical protein
MCVVWKEVYYNVRSKDNTCLNKGHAHTVAYKGVFIYFLRSSATGCTNQELRNIICSNEDSITKARIYISIFNV